MPIDYSKWKNIEISDDEDDTHPNIDTPSLYKWRHEARVQRMKEFEEKKKKAEEEQKTKTNQLEDMKKKLEEKAAKPDQNLESLKKSLNELEKQTEDANKKLEEVKKEEKLQAWNVDTIGKEGFNKTIVNSGPKPSQKEMTDEEKENYMKAFVEKHEKELKEFGWLRKYEDSKHYLMERSYLACEETANFLVIECVNHAMEEEFELMDHVAHQCICMQYLLELAKQLDLDPRACISSFFSKIQRADPEYMKTFQEELDAFKARIRKRAEEKVQEAIRKHEEEERQKRLGPGGLDPEEVLNSLPEALQKCFESRDIALLQKTIAEMPAEDARYHMKRCVDSGLWKPSTDDPDTNPEDGFKKGAFDKNEEEESSNVYEQVNPVDEKAD